MHDFTKQREKRSRGPTASWLWPALAALIGIILPGCVYDPDEPCGEGFEVWKNESGQLVRCVCPDDTVFTGDSCEKCGKHEIPMGSACVCKDGYAKNSDGDCEEIPDEPPPTGDGGAGDAATPAEEPPEDDGPPDGLGQPCSAPEDCAGTEATFCDLVLDQVCLQEHCDLQNDNCWGDYACCDLSFFEGLDTVCLPIGACMQ